MVGTDRRAVRVFDRVGIELFCPNILSPWLRASVCAILQSALYALLDQYIYSHARSLRSLKPPSHKGTII